MSVQWVSVLLVVTAGLARGQYDPPVPDMYLLDLNGSPKGLHMSIPDATGITRWAVHYSVNKQVPGTSAGDYNYDVTTKTGDRWVHENPDLQIEVGDTVYYWTNTLVGGAGYNLLDQSWTADSSGPGQTPAPPPATCPPCSCTTPAPLPGATTTRDSAGTVPPPAEFECTSYPCLIFEDNFDTLDFDKWQHELTAGGGGNWEFQHYTNNRTNSYAKGGLLYLNPTLTEDSFYPGFISSGTLAIWGASPANLCTGNAWYGCERAGSATNYINPAQSARLRSVHGFNFRYGRVEVEAQMPKGDWLWPAIWLLPTHNEYGEWPSSGEIDLVESRGNSDLRDGSGNQQGNTVMGSTLHWGPTFEYNRYHQTTASATGDFADSMHTYAVEWDETHIQFEVDGNVILNVDPPTSFWDYGNFPSGMANPWQTGSSMAPFDRPFYIIMNVAVGGTGGYFPDGWTNAGYPKPWLNTSPTGPKDFWEAKDSWYPTWNPETASDAAMKVNYVRVFKQKADPVTK